MVRSTKSDPVDVHIGHAIRARRAALDLPVSILASAIGVSHQQVTHYELARNRIAASMLAKVARALGATPGDFYPPPEP